MTPPQDSPHLRWARFRFSVVGRLLAAPPPRGQLRPALQALADTDWTHPFTGDPIRFGYSTIERWYYAALHAGPDTLAVLQRRPRKDAGTHPSLSDALANKLRAQHRDHRRWSYQLHHDNLAVLVSRDPSLGRLPSYSTLRRYMRDQGLLRARGRRVPDTEGAERAAERFEQREVRSYEMEHVGALFHVDFHVGSRAILHESGEWRRPQLYSCLDDRSRLVCHLQWYWSESAQTVAHGTLQAFVKRGLPRKFMTDRGSAMLAKEIQAGLECLGVEHTPTLGYSPYQNAKQEAFWNVVEGRLLPMLEGVEELDLHELNEVTQAWVEQDYNRGVHSELETSPHQRWLEDPRVLRDPPSLERVRESFRRTEARRQRLSDGTVLVAGRRFVVPSEWGAKAQLRVRYAHWDLTQVHLVDERGEVVCRVWPEDRARQADGVRASRGGPSVSGRGTPLEAPRASGIAPLLQEQLEAYRRGDVGGAYLPLSEDAQ